MLSPLRRVLFVALAVVLLATSCSSSDDTQSADTVGGGEAAAEPTAETTEPTTPPVAESTSIPVPDEDPAADDAIAGLDDDGGADTGPADPETTARDFLRNRFNIDPEPAWVACIVGEADSDAALAAALLEPSVGAGDIDDSELRALTFAINGCVDSQGLGDWATQAVGPQGDVQQTAPPCFAEKFDEAEGDLTFYTFVALSYQFRLDPAGSDSLVGALTDCVPITSLGDFFASQAEQASGFETIIDRECLQDALSPTEVSQGFWQTFIDGGRPPADYIDPFTTECAEAANADLATEIPSDFVPWSGTRALASVSPAARAGIYSAPPPMSLTEGATYEAVIATGGNEVRIRLLTDTAPITVNNFVSLARDGYFDGTVFHRVLADFMAQGGDPTGTGTGGPGYQFEDEVANGPALDREGLLAMANSGPGTNGSQFFITFVPTEWLTGNHTVFGEVTSGMDVVNGIELRDPAAPASRGQVIDSVTIIES